MMWLLSCRSRASSFISSRSSSMLSKAEAREVAVPEAEAARSEPLPWEAPHQASPYSCS